MANRYFVWKDPNCNGINPEWIELTPQEFYAFVNCPLNEGRHFIDFNEDCNEEEDALKMEVTATEYAEWDRRRHRYRYRREIEQEYADFVVSLDQEVPNSEDLLFRDVVADPDSDTADEAIHQMDLVKLRAALDKLTPEELELINALFLNNPDKRSERAIAKDLGVAQMTLNDRKRKILKKLK
ncbi:MAG: hypothetical protein E7446_06570 [Ruminococcaceae bacterium]|nr:hypothetical protein [Oscillospiraceae bacterium]